MPLLPAQPPTTHPRSNGRLRLAASSHSGKFVQGARTPSHSRPSTPSRSRPATPSPPATPPHSSKLVQGARTSSPPAVAPTLAVAHKRKSVSCTFPVSGPLGSGVFQLKAVRNGGLYCLIFTVTVTVLVFDILQALSCVSDDFTTNS